MNIDAQVKQDLEVKERLQERFSKFKQNEAKVIEPMFTVSEFLRAKGIYARELAREIGRMATSLTLGAVKRKDIGEGKHVNLYTLDVLNEAYDKSCEYLNKNVQDDLDNTACGWDFMGGIN